MTQDEQAGALVGAGLTALAVAAARAIETHRPEPLVTDPFAAGFVTAAGAPLPTRPADLDGPAGGAGAYTEGSAAGQTWGLISGYVGVRSRFFDHYLAGTVRRDVDQVVVLAAGLDTRAFRLDWPAGRDVFEIDQPEVLRFKGAVLDEQGARARCRRTTVEIDLRADWSAALTGSGFDPGRPTAWLAEGLLPYLPADTERELFDQVHALSAPGSRLAVEHIDVGGVMALGGPAMREAGAQVGIDLGTLLHVEDKPHPHRTLTGLGWTVHSESVADVAHRYRRELCGPLAGAMLAHTALVTASLGGSPPA